MFFTGTSLCHSLVRHLVGQRLEPIILNGLLFLRKQRAGFQKCFRLINMHVPAVDGTHYKSDLCEPSTGAFETLTGINESYWSKALGLPGRNTLCLLTKNLFKQRHDFLYNKTYQQTADGTTQCLGKPRNKGNMC